MAVTSSDEREFDELVDKIHYVIRACDECGINFDPDEFEVSIDFFNMGEYPTELWPTWRICAECVDDMGETSEL